METFLFYLMLYELFCSLILQKMASITMGTPLELSSELTSNMQKTKHGLLQFT